jgi:predicted XRE-type DNA-binding protein
MAKKNNLPDFEMGTTNFFADIGMPDPEAHLLKAQIVSEIYDIVKRRRLAQAAVAEMLGIGQPDVSRMLRGDFRHYSVQRLLRFLTAFDREVEILIKPRPKSQPGRGRVSIKAA